GDRTSRRTGISILEDGHCVIRRRTECWIEASAQCPLVNPPAKVSGECDDRHLFPLALSDIAGVKLLCAAAVERPPPWVPDAYREYFIRSVSAHIRIVGRYGVRRIPIIAGHIRRDPQKFAQQLVDILRSAGGIVGRAAVAHAHV